MNKWVISAFFISFSAGAAEAEAGDTLKTLSRISIGTRNTISIFNDDNATGTGIGGQVRYRLSDHINTEWFADFIPSQTALTTRNDYHIGWSLMFYFTHHLHPDHLLQPYLLAGHCFDLSVVSAKNNDANAAKVFTGATQAGLGTHLNMTSHFDCSLSTQYMLHFGKGISAIEKDHSVEIQRSNDVRPDGHLLLTLSFNYRL